MQILMLMIIKKDTLIKLIVKQLKKLKIQMNNIND